jgi:EAL domain-containing protein (putative c-di-GMP-specific phosphodiesterase class I)
LGLHVNLSVRQFSDEHLLGEISAIIAATCIDPTHLELEITENMLMQDAEKSADLLAKLKAKGIRLTIDDFGTGYSSLANLKRFALDSIKMDRPFVRDLSRSADDKGITYAVIKMGKTLSLNVIAAGVETKEPLDFLRDHSCDEFQGFYGS